MVERTGTFAVFPVARQKLNERSAAVQARIGELIAEELRSARLSGSAFARYGRPSRIPRLKRLQTA